MAGLGVPVIAIMTVAVLGEQVPLLETDHCKMLGPGLNVTEVTAWAGAAIVPLPCINDQVPVLVKEPINGRVTTLGLGGVALIVRTEFVRQRV